MAQKIVVIDDDPVNVMLITSILHECEYEVMNYYDGESGYRSAVENLPDLILLDWNMPGKSGIEILRELKSNEKTSIIPVIMITGMMTSVDNMLEAFSAGVIDFIRKPFEKLELVARTRSILMLSEYYREKLESNKKELVSLAMRLVESNEFNNELLRKISEIKGRYAEQSSTIFGEIDSIEQMVNSRLRGGSWQRFDDYFKMVNPAFYPNLLKSHPDLTPAELKLCSLLRLNISTKDIAVLLCQSPDSVRVSRARLRKKLGLESENNLVAYLLSF